MRLFIGLWLLLCLPARPQWMPINGPGGPSIEALFQADSVLFAGARGATYRSRDGGMNWELIMSPLTSRGFAASGRFIFSLSGPGVLRSDNGGDTWDTVYAGKADTTAGNLAAYAGQLFIGTSRGIYRSADQGAHWMRSSDGLEADYVGPLVPEGSWLLAFSPDGLYRSADTGRTWARSGTGLPTGHYGRGIARTLAHLFAEDGGGIFRSPDSGATWTPCPGPIPDSSIYGLWAEGRELFASTPSGLFRSSDEAATFTRIDGDLGGQFLGLVSARRGSELFLGTTQGVYRTVDRGATWQGRNRGMWTGAISDFQSVGANLYAAMGDWGCHRTSDRGETWTRIGVAGNPTLLTADSGVLYAGIASWNIRTSRDTGTTWRDFSYGLTLRSGLLDLEAGGGFVYALIFGPSGSAGGAEIFRTRSREANWYSCKSNLTRAQDLLWHGSTLYVTSDSGIESSRDHGETWSAPVRPGGKRVYMLAAMGRFLVASGPDGLYRSGDGADWTLADPVPGSPGPVETWSTLAATSIGFFAGSQSGAILYSGDSGATWMPLPADKSFYANPVRAFAEHQGEIYAGMFGAYKRPASALGLKGDRPKAIRPAGPRARIRSVLGILRGFGADLLGRAGNPQGSRNR